MNVHPTAQQPPRRINPVSNQPANNTKQQGRFWMATIPSNKWERWERLQGSCTWARGQEEVGAGGYRHWQIILGFASPIRFNKVKSLLPNETHLELTRSAFADEYVWKEDTRVEGTCFELGCVIKLL
uniref:Replication associated protein n=1 Tax=Circoviridae sp. TaxID=1954248 RepID=A0A345N0X4_9VIRU